MKELDIRVGQALDIACTKITMGDLFTIKNDKFLNILKTIK